MSETIQPPAPTNNPNLENSIPELTLPKVQWFTPKPFYIDVNVEEPDLEQDTPFGQPKYPPFFPIITEIGTPVYDGEGNYISRTVTTKLHMVQGYVHSYGLTEAATMTSTPVGNMPTTSSKIDIDEGTKCWVIAVENASGDLEDPTFDHGEEWPDELNSAAKLIGGEDATGAAGNRVWKICEIINIAGEDEDPILAVVMHRTGIIEHHTPRRVENTTFYSTDEATVMKESLQEDGTFRLRVLKGLRGLTMENGGDGDDYALIGLPTGVQGDILYYDGTAETGSWVKLPAPTSGLHVLTHDGTVPSWTATYECESTP